MRKLLQGCWSRGLKRRPLLQTSSPLKPKTREDSHQDWYSRRGHFNAYVSLPFLLRPPPGFGKPSPDFGALRFG